MGIQYSKGLTWGFPYVEVRTWESPFLRIHHWSFQRAFAIRQRCGSFWIFRKYNLPLNLLTDSRRMIKDKIVRWGFHLLSHVKILDLCGLKDEIRANLITKATLRALFANHVHRDMAYLHGYNYHLITFCHLVSYFDG